MKYVFKYEDYIFVCTFTVYANNGNVCIGVGFVFGKWVSIFDIVFLFFRL